MEMFSNRLRTLVVTLAGMVLLAPPAQATIAIEVFDFTGVCTDCTGNATATLILLAGYVPGTPLATMDLYSFNYSSNLTSFSIHNDQTATLSGELPATSGPADVTISGMNGTFTSALDGTWSADVPTPSDMGTSGIWTVPAGGSSTPEPQSFTFVGLGLLLLGIAVRMKPLLVRFGLRS